MTTGHVKGLHAIYIFWRQPQVLCCGDYFVLFRFIAVIPPRRIRLNNHPSGIDEPNGRVEVCNCGCMANGGTFVAILLLIITF